MKRYLSLILLGGMVALVGCAKTTHPINGQKPLANHSEWTSTLDPGNAINLVAQNVTVFGFTGEKSFWGNTSAPKPTGDYFDQGFNTVNAHGQAMNARVLWLNETSTQIIIESALPKDRHAFVIKKIMAAVAEKEKQTRR